MRIETFLMLLVLENYLYLNKSCRLLFLGRIKTINLLFEKIARSSLSNRTSTCHHDIVPEVKFAVNT